MFRYIFIEQRENIDSQPFADEYATRIFDWTGQKDATTNDQISFWSCHSNTKSRALLLVARSRKQLPFIHGPRDIASMIRLQSGESRDRYPSIEDLIERRVTSRVRNT